MELNAVIFDVQRFSVHDGPGIRTSVFFKGCSLRCAWCQNPESLRGKPELAVYVDRCHGKGDCEDACPKNALFLDGDRVRLDRKVCDVCGACAPACPYEALRVVGRTTTVDDLYEEVARDRPFFEASGGGVTLSGGEPTAQMKFVAAFVRRCRAEGVRVGLQTCGAFSWEALEPLLDSLQFVHFDLKLIDARAHRELAGADNATILDNARKLVGTDTPVVFRTPIVPGCTDSKDNLQAIAAFVRDVGKREIHLLRYHDMGEAKLAQIDAPLSPLLPGSAAGSVERVNQAAGVLEGEGLVVTT